VLATQNPIEQEGTYQLPEAQVDRFMLKVSISYPSKGEEREIVDRMAATRPSTDVTAIVELDEVARARAIVDQIYLDPAIRDYIIELVRATREPKAIGLDLARFIEFGASPRASINLALASRAMAFMQGRAYVTPSDVKQIAPDVLRHRVIISYEGQADGVSSDDIITQILDHVAIP